MVGFLGFALLFFLPVIESVSRSAGLICLFAGVLLLAFLFRNKRLTLDGIEILFLLFLASLSISSFFSLSIGRSLTETARYIAYFLIFVLWRRFLDKSGKSRQFLVSSLVINSLILTFLFIIYHFFGNNLPKIYAGMNLFYPVFGHNRIAAILIIAIPVMLTLLEINRDKRKRLTVKILSLLFFLILLLSFSRGALWMLSLSLLVLPLLIKIKSSFIRKTILYYAGAAAFLIFLIFLYSHFFTTRQQGVYSYLGLYKPLAFEKRLDYFTQALHGFAASPFFGNGPDTFRYVSKMKQDQPASWSWYVHNQFLQLYSDSGFFGGTFFILLMILLFWEALEKVKQDHDVALAGIFIALLASFLHSLIDFDWQFVSPLLYFFIGFSVLLPIKVNHKVGLKIGYLFGVALILFTSVFVLQFYNSDRLLALSPKLIKSTDTQKALIYLNISRKLDNTYNEIYKKEAEIYTKAGNYELAHKNYKKAIVLDPLDSGELIKMDFSLYLKEAKVDLNDGNLDLAYSVLIKSNKTYPYFLEKYFGNGLDKSNLNAYLSEMEKIVNQNPLRIWEIKIIMNHWKNKVD